MRSVIILCGYRPRSLVVASVVCEAGLPSSVLVWSGYLLLTVHRAQFSGIVLRSSVLANFFCFPTISAGFSTIDFFKNSPVCGASERERERGSEWPKQ